MLINVVRVGRCVGLGVGSNELENGSEPFAAITETSVNEKLSAKVRNDLSTESAVQKVP